jgi:hypothetical protein
LSYFLREIWVLLTLVAFKTNTPLPVSDRLCYISVSYTNTHTDMFSLSQSALYSFVFYQRILAKVTGRVLTLPKHPSWPPVFSADGVDQSLIFYVEFCRSYLGLLSFIIWLNYYLCFMIIPVVYYLTHYKPNTECIVYLAIQSVYTFNVLK